MHDNFLRNQIIEAQKQYRCENSAKQIVDYVKNATCAVLGKEDGQLLVSTYLQTGSTSLRTYDGRYLELPTKYGIKSFVEKYITESDREFYNKMLLGGK